MSSKSSMRAPLPRPESGLAQPAAAAAAAVAMPSGGLDPVALGKLRELDPSGRLGVVQRILKTYEVSLQRAILQLQSLRSTQAVPAAVERPQVQLGVAAGQTAAQQLAALAHTLKSSSAAVGALALARASESCEKRLNLNPELDEEPEIEQLLTAAEAALGAVQAMLDR